MRRRRLRGRSEQPPLSRPASQTRHRVQSNRQAATAGEQVGNRPERSGGRGLGVAASAAAATSRLSCSSSSPHSTFDSQRSSGVSTHALTLFHSPCILLLCSACLLPQSNSNRQRNRRLTPPSASHPTVRQQQPAFRQAHACRTLNPRQLLRDAQHASSALEKKRRRKRMGAATSTCQHATAASSRRPCQPSSTRQRDRRSLSRLPSAVAMMCWLSSWHSST